MDMSSIEERRKHLEERMNQMKATPLVAVRLDVLEKLIRDFNSNEELRGLFGNPVSRHLSLIWDKANNEVLVADANVGEVSSASELRFLKALHDVVEKDLR
ncbi:MAG: hypothetical protein V1744_03720 [Candidatus Altiarchaeota archaeon]